MSEYVECESYDVMSEFGQHFQNMSISKYLRNSAVMLLVACCIHPIAHLQADPPDRLPNVVLIIGDDQSWGDYGFMGHPHIETPSLDQLASQSCVFTRGYVPTSLCRPSLATIITGLYPSQHGITGNDPAIGKGINPRNNDQYKAKKQNYINRMKNLPTLPRLLAKRGYRSFQSGKWWEGNYAVGGFDAGMTHGDPKKGGRHGDVGLKIGRQGLQPIFDFIEQSKDKPFFVWYAPFLPHTPHNPPKKLFEKYRDKKIPDRLAKYYAMCEWFDQTCGSLLAHLDKTGHAKNTIVIFVTDNGWIQRTPKSVVPKGWRWQFAPRSKQSPYEGGVRTPIMIRWPDRLKPRFDKTTVVSSIDIAPTILSAVKMKPSAEMTGIDLVPVGRDATKNSRKMIWGEIFSHDMADINDPSKSLLYRWVIRDFDKIVVHFRGKTGRHGLAHRRDDFSTQFFDLKSDPNEKQNIAANRRPQVEKLEKQLQQETKSIQLLKLKQP